MGHVDMEMSAELAKANVAAEDILNGLFDVCRRASKKHGGVSSSVINCAVGSLLASAIEGACHGNLFLFYSWRDETLSVINRHFEIAAARITEIEKTKTAD